jgi:hypothetical protein
MLAVERIGASAGVAGPGVVPAAAAAAAEGRCAR